MSPPAQQALPPAPLSSTNERPLPCAATSVSFVVRGAATCREPEALGGR
jgi:hypothetical protein